MTDFFDDLESRSREAREADLFDALRRQLAHAAANAPTYARTLGGVDPAAITDRAALAALPILRKSDLPALQDEAPPLGGLATREPGAFRRLYLSPGPIVEPEGDEEHWRMGRALHAAGIGRNDRILNAFAYHLTPAGVMFDHAAAAVGAVVFPGGVGNTEQQVAAIERLRLTAYVGTPDFLKTILERGDDSGVHPRVFRPGIAAVGGKVETGITDGQAHIRVLCHRARKAHMELPANILRGPCGNAGKGLRVAAPTRLRNRIAPRRAVIAKRRPVGKHAKAVLRRKWRGKGGGEGKRDGEPSHSRLPSLPIP